MRSHSILLAGVFLLAALPVLGQTPPAPARTNLPELKKLQVLLAIDTNSALSDSVDADRRNMETLLRKHIPEERLELTVLQGEQLTRDGILQYFKNLKTSPDDAVLFFYAGHGKIDEQKKPYFAPQKGKVPTITRAEVRRAMSEKKPGLIILLSDCCSTENRLRLQGEDAAGKRERSLRESALHPTLRCLFFQHRGVVDITAAQEGTGSFGHYKRGGVFTQALVKLLDSDVKDLDTNKDRFVTWKEFADQLTRKTEELFEQLCEQARERQKWDIKKEQKNQRPQFYSLPDGPQTYAVVSLFNKTGGPYRYRYRWSTEKEWKQGQLEKDGKRVLELVLKIDAEGEVLPRLEIESVGERGSIRIEPRRWSGSSKPQYKDGREYEIHTEDR